MTQLKVLSDCSGSLNISQILTYENDILEVFIKTGRQSDATEKALKDSLLFFCLPMLCWMTWNKQLHLSVLNFHICKKKIMRLNSSANKLFSFSYLGVETTTEGNFW